MSKTKFKVGDRVKVVKITGSQDKAEHVGKTLTVSFVLGDAGYKYSLKGSNGLSSGWYYSDEELELAKEERTYTGIELLQAIKDGAFKDGDRFKVYLKGFKVDVATISLSSIYDLTIKSEKKLNSRLMLSDIFNCKFTPIKKEPINLAPENKSINVNLTTVIKGEALLKDNTITVILNDGSIGTSKCNPEDKFNEDLGLKIATTRAIKNQADKALKKLIDSIE